MVFIIIAVVAAVACIASLIYGPRIKDSASTKFKACVAVSAVNLVLAAGCGFIAYTTFDMGDPDAVQQRVVDDKFDLWLPQDGSPLVIDSVQNENGVWCYAIHTINLATWQEDMKYVPADVTTFLDTGPDGHSYLEWTEKYAILGDQEFHTDASGVSLGYRNDEEMKQSIQSKLTPANCVVYVPRGTIVNHPPVLANPEVADPNAAQQDPNAAQIDPATGQPVVPAVQ